MQCYEMESYMAEKERIINKHSNIEIEDILNVAAYTLSHKPSFALKRKLRQPGYVQSAAMFVMGYLKRKPPERSE
ncbi:hypothetical protein STEG23_024441 [Scotinomys teguina]